MAAVVDPVTLSIGAIAAAMVVRAAEKTGETAVEAGASALGPLVRWLRDRFSRGDGDEVAAAALSKVEDAPDSPSRVRALAEEIDRKAASDAKFKAGLEDLIREAKDQGVDMKAVSQIAEGSGIVQVANTEHTTITVSQGSVPPAAGPATSPAPKTSDG
jgi:hypothetical protein